MTERICKKCLLRDMENADREMIKKYKDAIRQEDQADEDEYEKRLAVCTKCEKLNAGTCLSCGCYVELRAASRIAHCPNKKW